MSPSINSKVAGLIQEATKNDNTNSPLSLFHSIADDTMTHPEDIRTILDELWRNLKSPANDWRKINKTLGLLVVLLKFGNPVLIEECRKKANTFKELMEFFFVESRLDKGGVIRDKARILFFMLTTNGFVEGEREDARRGSGPDRLAESTSWGISEKSVRRQEGVFKQPQEDRRQPEPKKQINVFEGINVKNKQNIPDNRKNVIQNDLLGDFSETYPTTVKQNPQPLSKAPEDLLMLSESFPSSVPSSSPSKLPDLLLDLPITSQPQPRPLENKVEIIDKKPEPKISFNMSGQGISMNLIKNTPSLNINPEPKQPSPPKDLESRLLNLDGLSTSLTKETPKPLPQRSYY